MSEQEKIGALMGRIQKLEQTLNFLRDTFKTCGPILDAFALNCAFRILEDRVTALENHQLPSQVGRLAERVSRLGKLEQRVEALEIDPSDNAPCDDEYVPADPQLAAGSRALIETIGAPIRNASQLGDDALGENS